MPPRPPVERAHCRGRDAAGTDAPHPLSPAVPGKGQRAPSSGGDFRAPYSAIPHTIVTLAVIFTSPAATGTGAAALKLASAIGIGTGGW